MYDDLAKLTPLLGVILVAIGSYFMYRRTEDKRSAAYQEVKEAMPRVLGDGLAAGRGCEMIVDAITDQTKAIIEARADAERPLKRSYDVLCDISETLHKLRHDLNGHEANRQADAVNRAKRGS